MTTATRPPSAESRLPEGLPELPQGWAWTTLGELSSKITSGSRDWKVYYGRGTGTFILAQNVRMGRLDLSYRQPVDPPVGNRDRFRSQVAENDLLITIVGANTGDVCRVPHELPEHYVCQSVALVRLHSPELARFVELYLTATDHGQSQFQQFIYGAGRPHLSFDDLKSTAVPLPPTHEQRRIVERVEALLAQARTAREALAPVSTLVRQLRQAVLAAAFSGRLSEPEPGDEPAGELLERIRAERALLGGRKGRDDARSLPEGLPELPEGWSWATVEELAAPDPYALTDGPFGSNLKTADYVTAGARVIRLQNIGVGEFKDDNRAYISDQKFAELQKHEALAGDIIIAALADPVGRACVVPEGIGKAIVKADCIRLRPNSSLADRRFVMLALNTSTHFKRAAEAAHGVGRERVNLGAIRNFAIPLAPLAEQRRIVARVEALLAQADVIEQAVSATSVRIADMERAVLARAFRGELVE